MVALPKSIIAQLRTMKYPSKTFTMKEWKRAFAMNGYGAGKTIKWLEYYVEQGLIEELPDGNFTCVLW